VFDELSTWFVFARPDDYVRFKTVGDIVKLITSTGVFSPEQAPKIPGWPPDWLGKQES
jgi:hypothetical protein